MMPQLLSKILPYLSDISPIYSGFTIIQRNINEGEKSTLRIFSLIKGGSIFAFGNKHSIILNAKGDGSIAFYTGEKADAHWVKKSGIDFANLDDVKKRFSNNFSNWNAIYHDLFATAK